MKKLIKLEVMVVVLFSSTIAGPVGSRERLVETLIKAGRKANYYPIQTLEDAAAAGDINSVKKLVNSGANINQQNFAGNTPLMLAIMNADNEPNEYIEVISYLLEEDADYQIKNNNSETALDISISKSPVYPVYKEIEDLIRKKHREMQDEKILLMRAARAKNPESPFYYRKMPKDIFNEIIKQYLEETKLE